MGFFKSGFKGGLIGSALGTLAMGIISLPFVPVTAGMSVPIALAVGFFGGGTVGSMFGGAFGLADDDDKDREYDRDTDSRIRDAVADQLRDKEKAKEKEGPGGMLSQILGIFGPVLAILGVGGTVGAAYFGWKAYKAKNEEKPKGGPDDQPKSQPDASTQKPEGQAKDDVPATNSIRPRREVLASTNISDGKLKLAVAGLSSARDPRHIEGSAPDGITHTAAASPVQKVRSHE